MRKRLSHLHPSFRFSCLNCFGIRSREARITKAPLALLLLPLPTLALDCKSDEGLIKSLVELRNGDFGIPIEEPTSGWDGEEAGTVDESSKEVAMEEPDECEEREREGEEESSDFYGEFLLFVPVHEADSGRPGPYRAGCKWVERLGTSTGPGLVARFSPRQYHKNFDKIVLRIYLVSTKLKRGYAIFILKKCNLSPHELPSDEYKS